MKRRIVLAGIVMGMSAVMLTGCNPKKNYESDVEELQDVPSFDEMEDEDVDGIIDALDDAISDLDVKTAEGKDIKSDLEDYLNMIEANEKLFKEQPIEDYELVTNKLNKLDKIADKLLDHVEDFRDAAKEAGVDKDKLEDVGIIAYVEESRLADDIEAVDEVVQALKAGYTNDEFTISGTETITMSHSEDPDPGSNTDLADCLKNSDVDKNRFKSPKWGTVTLTLSEATTGALQVDISESGEKDGLKMSREYEKYKKYK